MRSTGLLSPPPSPHPAPMPLPLPSSVSALPLCPELDLSVSLSPAPKTVPAKPRPHRGSGSSPAHPKPRPHRGSQSSPTCAKPRPHKGSEARKKRQVCFEEPVVVTVTPQPSDPLSNTLLPQQPTRSLRSGRRHGRAHGQGAGPPAAAASEESACLEGAELNTSLALKVELQSLQGAEFDSQKAVQETLRRSERTKNLINSKATEGVNVSRSQQLYSSLVSVEVETDQLISRVLQDRLQLAPPPRHHDNKAADGPSPLLFLTSDLHRQKPLPPEEPVSIKPRPLPRPAHSTFDLYRRHTRWQATP